ncbi:hypothetical protein BXZ70DRAFT_453460 [Cristinia sonorae]|uniref:DUF6533 domain-containing protein n=1 Tax=Cristinia sonorae TaxID=1940300 RepID=A0A8K0UJD4_9AGAR|nr:hypothetical protein BXZ70DRAFT_453460 [Cristinia sonorae]
MVFYNETLAVQYSYTFSAAVIAAYDAALTISREVRQIWKGKFSAVTVLYLILRWGTLTHTILDLLLIVYVAPPSILLQVYLCNRQYLGRALLILRRHFLSSTSVGNSGNALEGYQVPLPDGLAGLDSKPLYPMCQHI